MLRRQADADFRAFVCQYEQLANQGLTTRQHQLILALAQAYLEDAQDPSYRDTSIMEAILEELCGDTRSVDISLDRLA